MISIRTEKLGKRFNREWIFRNFESEIKPAEKLAITGSNGSGKSTLLLMLGGYVMPSEGKVRWFEGDTQLEQDEIYKKITFASPALELIEEFTPVEIIDHQRKFKGFQNNNSIQEILSIAELEQHKNKVIKNFSSGMKQRLKLTLAILSDCPILFLDEPVTNLDKEAIQWYLNIIDNFAGHKTIVVCSNKIREEYLFCVREININEYK